MAGPREAGHREKFGGRHAAISLAVSTFLFQVILQVRRPAPSRIARAPEPKLCLHKRFNCAVATPPPLSGALKPTARAHAPPAAAR